MIETVADYVFAYGDTFGIAVLSIWTLITLKYHLQFLFWGEDDR